MKIKLVSACILIGILMTNCKNPDVSDKTNGKRFTGAKGEVILMTVDPGHFHAALVQKIMKEQIHPEVYIYAPDKTDVDDHLQRITAYNNRPENATNWISHVYKGDDFFERMLSEKRGNVMVVSGNNMKKTEYIKKAVEHGIHVFADKPMAIDMQDFEILQDAFTMAKEKQVLLYDIMTERFEITTILQKMVSQFPDVFGELEKGTPDNPAVTKESVHHFFKYVSGEKIKRPPWFFDRSQQGEGLVDVTTHLVDLIQWECFPDKIIDYQNDIKIKEARRWPTPVSHEQFMEVTRLSEVPEYLERSESDEKILDVYSNGAILYEINGIMAKVSVEWKYRAPEGGGDTHYSIMRGTKSNLIIRQGSEENYKPVLYIEPNDTSDLPEFLKNLDRMMKEIHKTYPGIELEDLDRGWKVIIPDQYKIGHEAHFGQVTDKFLQYLVDGKLPEWEVPNMITKYYITTKALEMALKE
jgi:predicted dehydrogenase